jgi:carbamoyltransferase
MTAILGISAFYHDSAAVLIVDGKIVAAAQEERFTRKKHDSSFPKQAIEFCLKQAGIGPEDLDHVGFYDKPVRKFDRLLETYLGYAPAGYPSFRRGIPLWLREKLFLPRMMDEGLGGKYRGRYVFSDHHESHAASAFFPSPFSSAAIVTFDGVGEWSTMCYGVGEGNRISLNQELRFPHSLGLLYSAFTYYAGFRVNSGEYKVMGLAPYGTPRFKDLILKHLIDLKTDGSFRMDMSYFNYCQGLTMTSPKFHQLFGGPPRQPESEITQREMDLAASIQAVTEEVMLCTANHVHQETGESNLVLAGGVALNCVGNGRILRESPFDNVWIQPAAGDAGGALGVAMLIWYQLLQNPRSVRPTDSQQGSLLGPSFGESEVIDLLQQKGAKYTVYDSDEALCEQVASLLDDQQVVGWFQGRMEFGPRALGARSILADARSPTMQSTMNLKIKFRESFRPFAPAVLKAHASELFEMEPDEESPYMLLVAPVRESIRKKSPTEFEKAVGPNRTNLERSTLPAITHVDDSARVQTVDDERNPMFHRLLSCFHERTGCPVLINSSFNVRGEPIVCTPEDAFRCFQLTDIDVLAIGRVVLLKKEQPEVTDEEKVQYRNQFQLD